MIESKLVRDLMTVGVPTCKRPDMSPQGAGQQGNILQVPACVHVLFSKCAIPLQRGLHANE